MSIRTITELMTILVDDKMNLLLKFKSWENILIVQLKLLNQLMPPTFDDINNSNEILVITKTGVKLLSYIKPGRPFQTK